MVEILKIYVWRPLYHIQLLLKRWYENKFIIPPYTEKRKILLGNKTKYHCKTFVESGTFLGETIESLKNDFDFLYSIELAEKLAIKAQQRFINDEHIKIIKGDSGNELKLIISISNPPILFWLDGHYYSSFFVGEEFIETAKGEISTPIIKELEAILFNGLLNNVILIDDARCFGKGDYPSIKELIKVVEKYGITSKQVSVKRDIIHIVPALKIMK